MFPDTQVSSPDMVVQVIVVLEHPFADLSLQKKVCNPFCHLCKQQPIILKAKRTSEVLSGLLEARKLGLVGTQVCQFVCALEALDQKGGCGEGIDILHLIISLTHCQVGQIVLRFLDQVDQAGKLVLEPVLPCRHARGLFPVRLRKSGHKGAVPSLAVTGFLVCKIEGPFIDQTFRPYLQGGKTILGRVDQ